MTERFTQNIKSNKLFNSKDKWLVAVSGGLDSVVLLHLLHNTGIKLGIVHCNFQLRSSESDADEMFVAALAKKYGCNIYVQRFNTAQFAEQKHVSIQMAARELRYQFFEEVRVKNKYRFIVTAHHATDNVETILINMIRGTGIKGLSGIPVKNGNVIRPLLEFAREEIEFYANSEKLKWREDSSNLSDDYLRNKLRHHVLPLLKNINPSLERTFLKHAEVIQGLYSVVENYIKHLKQEIITWKKEEAIIDLKKLLNRNESDTTWFELLREFNFDYDVVRQLHQSKKQSGKEFFSPTHRLTINQNRIIISYKEKERRQQFIINGTGKWSTGSYLIKVSMVKQSKKSMADIRSNKNSNIAFFNLASIQFPLTVRTWQKGDLFYPLGLGGKKLISDFYTDKKFSTMQKEKQLLLLSGNQIAWVIGHRTSEKFKVTEKMTAIYKFEIKPDE